MKKVFFTLALICVAQLSMAQDEAFKKDILKVIQVSGATSQIEIAKSQILKMIPADKQAAFLVEFNSTLPSFYDSMAKVYSETYTKDDIKAMLAFYDSPVGKKISASAGTIAEKGMEAGKEWGMGLQTLMMKYME